MSKEWSQFKALKKQGEMEMFEGAGDSWMLKVVVGVLMFVLLLLALVSTGDHFLDPSQILKPVDKQIKCDLFHT